MRDAATTEVFMQARRDSRSGFRYASSMFIPLGTNLGSTRRPWVVYAILALNSAIYALTSAGFRGGNAALGERVDRGAISLRWFEWWQPITGSGGT